MNRLAKTTLSLLSFLAVTLLAACGADQPVVKQPLVMRSANPEPAIDPNFNPFHKTYDEIKAYETQVMAQPGDAGTVQLFNLVQGYRGHVAKRGKTDFYRVADLAMARKDVDTVIFGIVTDETREDADAAFRAQQFQKTYDAAVAYMERWGFEKTRSYDSVQLASLIDAPDPIKSAEQQFALEYVVELANILKHEDAHIWQRHFADSIIADRGCGKCLNDPDYYGKAHTIYAALGDRKAAKAAATKAANYHLQYIGLRCACDAVVDEEGIAGAYAYLQKAGKSAAEARAIVQAKLDAAYDKAVGEKGEELYIARLRESIETFSKS